jgi:hypothetical protein
MMKRLYFTLLLTGCLLISVSELSRGHASSQYPMKGGKVPVKRAARLALQHVLRR